MEGLSRQTYLLGPKRTFQTTFSPHRYSDLNPVVKLRGPNFAQKFPEHNITQEQKEATPPEIKTGATKNNQTPTKQAKDQTKPQNTMLKETIKNTKETNHNNKNSCEALKDDKED